MKLCPAIVLGTLALALALPAVSHADCGGVETSHATHHRRGQIPPLAIGDSTMLLSLPGLAARGFDANAHGCRQFSDGLALIRQLKAEGRLPHMVVIALGGNGYVTHQNIGVALGMLCCTRLLVLVTPRQLGGTSGENAVVEHQEARRHKGRILLLDWVRYSAGHPNWFQPDGLHLTLPGVAAFTRLIAGALPRAYPRRHRRRRRPPIATTGGFRSDAVARQLPYGSALTLTTSLATPGFVAATVTGPAYAGVQLSEQLANGASTPVGTVQLSGAGTATVPHALTWRCDVLDRTLAASTVPPADPEATVATVTTPSCAGRLRAKVGRRARAGGAIALAVTDRWGIGSLPFSVCSTPPGGRRSCARESLTPGQRRSVVREATPRPGVWRFSVATAYGSSRPAGAWVSPAYGRLRLLAAGDSEMQILDGLLAADLGGHGVAVTSDARISTGLTKPFMFNWLSHAARQAASLRPDVSVVFIGANDGFAVSAPGGGQVNCCGPGWSAGYANLVAEMMRSYLRGQAGRVYWFVLPAPRPANFVPVFNAINAGIRAAAARFPGRVALIDADAVFTPGNVFRNYMFYAGHGFTVHESDGVHLSAASDAVAAGIVTRRLLADHVIR